MQGLRMSYFRQLPNQFCVVLSKHHNSADVRRQSFEHLSDSIENIHICFFEPLDEDEFECCSEILASFLEMK